MSPSAPAISTCASSEKYDASRWACPAVSVKAQPVDGQPRASWIATRENVGRSNS